MIDAREIQLHNIIKLKTNGKNVDVKAIDFDEYRSKPFEYYINNRPLSHYTEIPLTEEWLLKLGFEPYSDHSPYGFKNYRNHILFGVSIAGSQCQPVAEIGDYIVGDNYKVIKSVHQLQNYYYAITGQELTI